MERFLLKWRKNTYLKVYLLGGIFLLCSSISFAQEQAKVSGRIMDSDNETLIGVVVENLETKSKTVSDIGGNFTITAAPQSKLKFTYLGFSDQVVSVGTRTFLNVTLQNDALQLGEVVVSVGYGAMKKKDLTGATSSLQGGDIVGIPVTTAAQAISGKMAGVSVITQSGAPGATIDIVIRGGTSITQSSKPLYIVDGFAMADGLNHVDINDIESIDVMKDASSTAIYGARGSNGVVIVTTKGGKAGKTEVRYNGYISFEKLGKKLDLLGVEDYVKYQYEHQILAGKESAWANMFGGDTTDPSFYTGAYGRISDEYGNRKGIDWQEEVFGGTATMTNHNLSVTGGTDKTKFILSYNHTGQDGIVAKSGYTKNNIRAAINHELYKGVRVDFSSSFGSTEIEGGGSLGGMLKMSILQPITGGIKYTNDQLLNTDIGSEMAQDEGQYDIYNPLITNDATTQKKFSRQSVTNVGLEIDFLKNFTFRTAGSYEWRQTRSDFWDDGRTKTAETNLGPFGSRDNSESKRIQWTNTISWRQNFGKHGLNAMVGHELMDQSSLNLNAKFLKFPDNNFGLNNVGMSDKASSGFGSGTSSNRMVSVFARVMYNYDQRYLLTATIRGDGSSKFAVGKQWGTLPSVSAAWRVTEEAFMKNQKIFNNLKVRIGYGITGNNDIGNNMYATDYGATKYVVGNTEVIGLKPGGTLGNPALKWEQTKSINIGLDISVLKGRVNLTADYYNNKSDNLLIKATLPPHTGYVDQFQNMAALRNRGFEFVLNTLNIKSPRGFRWTSDFNISFNRSKVLKLYGETLKTSFISSASSRVEFLVEEGKPLGQFYGYKYDGVYTTSDFDQNPDGTYTLKSEVPSLKGKLRSSIKPGDVKYQRLTDEVDGNGNPVWSTADRSVIGNANPKFTGGFTNTFTYKGFDLSVFMTFAYGNKLFSMNSQRFRGPYLPNQNSLADMANRFALVDPLTGKEATDLARLAEMNPNQDSKNAMWSLNSGNKIAISDAIDSNIEDGSYLRLNNITLGYSIPKHLLKKIRINSLRVYATLNNIHTFTNYSGYDPEVSSTSSSITRGIDNSAYPKAKSYVVGINLTF